jgi:hypothetical protein
VEPGALESIREEVQAHARAERRFDVVLADDQGVAHAVFTKTIVVKKRRPREQAKRG